MCCPGRGHRFRLKASDGFGSSGAPEELSRNGVRFASDLKRLGMQAPTVIRKHNFPAGSRTDGEAQQSMETVLPSKSTVVDAHTAHDTPGKTLLTPRRTGGVDLFGVGPKRSAEQHSAQPNSVAGSVYGRSRASATAASVSLPSKMFSPFRMCGSSARTVECPRSANART